jgi:hypothetical protein
MVKGGARPNLASYHLVTSELYKGERVNEIVETVERLVFYQPTFIFIMN